MKSIGWIIVLMFSQAACNNPPEADRAETTEAKEVQTAEGAEYKVDTSSSITWTASKPTGKHIGHFDISDGNLIVNNKQLTGGEFTIDVASITNEDLAGDSTNQTRLETHLKSADFFDVANYPTAKFIITSVEPYITDSTDDIVLAGANQIISGNLTIRDSTKNVSFPARVLIKADTTTAAADFNINRTLWGMNYKGPNNPNDWFISKEVNIKINLNAIKK